MPVAISLIFWGILGFLRLSTHRLTDAARYERSSVWLWAVFTGLVFGFVTLGSYFLLAPLSQAVWNFLDPNFADNRHTDLFWYQHGRVIIFIIAVFLAVFVRKTLPRNFGKKKKRVALINSKVVVLYLVSTIVVSIVLGLLDRDTIAVPWRLFLVDVIGFLSLFFSYLFGCLLFPINPSPLAVTRMRDGRQIRKNNVAVVVPAYNEQSGILDTIKALFAAGIQPKDIYIGSDGSSDRTVDFAKKAGVNVLDIHTNGGKARAIANVIEAFGLRKRYLAISIVDGDTIPDKDYYDKAVLAFEDPEVSAVGPHWAPLFAKGESKFRYNKLVMAYRTRLFWLLQWTVRYGQTWSPVNVSFIIPGYAPLYRSDIISKINITKRNLVIEDFNMTFELHRKRLGKVAYLPAAKARTHEPATIGEFSRQIKRWYLGFWQTLFTNGVWMSGFWFALAPYVIEILLASLVRLCWPLLFLYLCFGPGELSVDLPFVPSLSMSPTDFILLFIGVDIVVTVFVALMTRHLVLILYAPAFLLLAWIESGVFIWTLISACFVRSDGRWKSPTRLPANTSGTGVSGV